MPALPPIVLTLLVLLLVLTTRCDAQVEEVAHVMAEVVQVMTAARRKERLAQCLEYVHTNTTSYWAAQLLMDLKAVGRSANRSIMSPVGLGLNFRVIGKGARWSGTVLCAGGGWGAFFCFAAGWDKI